MPSNHLHKLDMFPLCGEEKKVTTMQAMLLLGPGKIACQELPVPEPGPEDVVLKVESALTCGTDLKAFLRGHPKMPPPIRFGHEYSGTITACGSQVTNFREGDDVMLAPTGPCGCCFYCQHDQENLCTSLMTTMAFGGYAEYVNLPGRIVRSNMFSKPKSLPFVEAALLEPVSCVVFGLQQVRFTPEDTVVIIGAGGFGLLHLILLKMFGLERVYMVARNPDRARVASELGACRVIARPAEEAREEVLEATGGRGADLVIECTAQPSVWEESLFFARPGGQVVLFGGCPQGTKVSLDATRLHYDQIRLSSPFHFNPAAVRKASRLLISGQIPTEYLISGRYPLVDLCQAFDRMQRGEGIKYEVVP